MIKHAVLAANPLALEDLIDAVKKRDVRAWAKMSDENTGVITKDANVVIPETYFAGHTVQIRLVPGNEVFFTKDVFLDTDPSHLAKLTGSAPSEPAKKPAKHHR